MKELQIVSKSRKDQYFLNNVEGHERGIWVDTTKFPCVLDNKTKYLVTWDSEKRNYIKNIENVFLLNEYRFKVDVYVENNKPYLIVDKNIIENLDNELDLCNRNYYINLTEKSINTLSKAYNFNDFEPLLKNAKEKFNTLLNILKEDEKVINIYAYNREYISENIHKLLDLYEVTENISYPIYPRLSELIENHSKFIEDYNKYKATDKDLLALSFLIHTDYGLVSSDIFNLLNVSPKEVTVQREIQEVENDYLVTYLVTKTGKVYNTTFAPKHTKDLEEKGYYSTEDRLFEVKRNNTKTFVKKELIKQEEKIITINNNQYRVNGLIYTKI